MSGAWSRAVAGLAAVAAVGGCGGAVVDVGDERAGSAADANCAGFVGGADVCGVVGARDARAAEAAQTVSELYRLAREAALSIRWACDALAHMAPPAPNGPDAPAPTAADVEASCAAALARIEPLAGKVRVTVRSFAGDCQPTLCPTQGMPGCHASSGTAEVERLASDVDDRTLTVVRVAFEVLARARATPAVEISSRVASFRLQDGDLRASCVPPFVATAAAASALLTSSLASNARVVTALSR